MSGSLPRKFSADEFFLSIKHPLFHTSILLSFFFVLYCFLYPLPIPHLYPYLLKPFTIKKKPTPFSLPYSDQKFLIVCPSSEKESKLDQCKGTRRLSLIPHSKTTIISRLLARTNRSANILRHKPPSNGGLLLSSTTRK